MRLECLPSGLEGGSAGEVLDAVLLARDEKEINNPVKGAIKGARSRCSDAPGRSGGGREHRCSEDDRGPNAKKHGGLLILVSDGSIGTRLWNREIVRSRKQYVNYNVSIVRINVSVRNRSDRKVETLKSMSKTTLEEEEYSMSKTALEEEEDVV